MFNAPRGPVVARCAGVELFGLRPIGRLLVIGSMVRKLTRDLKEVIGVKEVAKFLCRAGSANVKRSDWRLKEKRL
jgi:hypothetical protein